MEQWVRERVDTYLRHGGKTSRRAMVKRLIAILLDIRGDPAEFGEKRTLRKL